MIQQSQQFCRGTMERKARTTIEVRVQKLRYCSFLSAESQITLLLTHNHKNDEVTNLYRYDQNSQSIRLDEYLVIDITGLQLTKHKHAILSLYLTKSAGRKQLIGTVPLHIHILNGQGILQHPVLCCPDQHARITISFEHKTYRNNDLAELLGCNLAKALGNIGKQKQNEGTTREDEERDLILGENDLKCQQQVLGKNLNSKIGSKQPLAQKSRHNQEIDKTSQALSKSVKPDKLQEYIQQHYLDRSALQLQSKLISSANHLSIHSQVVTVFVNADYIHKNLAVAGQFSLRHPVRQHSSEADLSILSKVDRPTEYSFIEESLELPKRQTLHGIHYHQLIQDYKILQEANKQLEICSLKLNMELSQERRQRKLRQRQQDETIGSLRSYISELESELQRMQSCISQKNSIHTACLDEIVRLVSQNQVLRGYFPLSTPPTYQSSALAQPIHRSCLIQNQSQNKSGHYGDLYAQTPNKTIKQTSQNIGQTRQNSPHQPHHPTALRIKNAYSTSSSPQKPEYYKPPKELATPFEQIAMESRITACFQSIVSDGHTKHPKGQPQRATSQEDNYKPKAVTQKFKVWKNMHLSVHH